MAPSPLELWTKRAENSVWTCIVTGHVPDLVVTIQRDRRPILGHRCHTRAEAERWAQQERTHLALD